MCQGFAETEPADGEVSERLLQPTTKPLFMLVMGACLIYAGVPYSRRLLLLSRCFRSCFGWYATGTAPDRQSLPDAWQGEYTEDRASRWIEERDRDGATLLVVERSSQMAIGLVILFESDDGRLGRSVRIGYLLAESVWGQGLASELLEGFVDWCRTVEIASIVGGVERENFASQRVLEKNGFTVLSDPKGRGDFVYRLQFN